MRIAMVTQQDSPTTPAGEPAGGGRARRVGELARAIAASGHEVRLFARADGHHPAGTTWLAPHVPVEYLRAGPERPMSDEVLLRHTRLFGDRLAAAWQRDGWTPDLVHAHYWLSGLAAVVATGQVPAPVVLTYHELGASAHRDPAGRAPGLRSRVGMERQLGRAVDRVIAQSHTEISELARLGVPRSQLALVPAGVDIDWFTPAVTPRPAGPRRLLSVGSADRLAERKGFTDLIRALPMVPRARLLLVGGPPRPELQRNRAIGRLRSTATGTGVADRVRFAGRIPRDEMPGWYRAADVMVCGSWHEPAGASALEAMAAGVPVIATDIGTLRDIVVDGVTGDLVPPRDPAALAYAVRALLADPVRRMEYGAAGLDRVHQIHSWDRVASQLDQHYRELASASA